MTKPPVADRKIQTEPIKWSWRVATVAGIPIYIHGTFVVLIIFLLVDGFSQGESIRAAVSSVLFVLAIFATIVLHELGHALTAQRFGIRTRDITLLPIGGLARLERMPDVPRQELWVALAGPAVNLVIAGVALAVVLVSGEAVPRVTLESGADGVIGRFIAVNVWLALFNLLPAFPMDGGRALRALLAERTDYVRATEIAATIGQGLALVFGFIGLMANPLLIFIALFVWMGASAEASFVSVRGALAGIPVSRAMITDFRAVEAESPLQHVIDLVLTGSQRDFPVLDNGVLVGVLTQDRLLAALHERGPMGTIRQAMTTTFETVDAREMLDGAFMRLQTCNCTVMPVLYDQRLVGLLTPENIAEYVMIRGALRPAGARRPGFLG